MRRVAAGALTLSMVLAGCSGGGRDDAAPDPSPSTTAAAAACPAAPAMPAGATDLTSGPGDFNGDGRPDRLSVYRVGSAAAWHLRAELDGAGAVETELPAGAQGVKAVGGARLDVGPADAAFAVVGADPAGGVDVGLFVLRSCRLERVTMGGAPAELPVRVAANARSGLACQVPGLVVYTATSTDGVGYVASSVSYLLVGNLLDEAHRSTSTLPANDPGLAAFGAFSCGVLRL